jgi:glycosyltransferase involved in cell wall biosynthesis
VLTEARAAGVAVEVIVVDDGSTDGTSQEAERAGARLVPLDGVGNPGAARNRGAEQASGDVLVFLDADCVPVRGWMAALVAAHVAGEACVGGAIGLPPGLSTTARWDYYFSSYHVHPERPAGPVPNHPPANVSVRRAAFEATRRFTERLPVAHGHEELAWQAALARAGERCYFEPAAQVQHYNRVGLANMMRRSYRWGYSAIQGKAESGAARWSRLYDYPVLLVAMSLASAPAQAVYIARCWWRVGKLEPVLAFPVLVLGRLVYAVGMAVGGWRWLASERSPRSSAVVPESR